MPRVSADNFQRPPDTAISRNRRVSLTTISPTARKVRTYIYSRPRKLGHKSPPWSCSVVVNHVASQSIVIAPHCKMGDNHNGCSEGRKFEPCHDHALQSILFTPLSFIFRPCLVDGHDVSPIPPACDFRHTRTSQHTGSRGRDFLIGNDIGLVEYRL
jgi:hypothetical protein